MRPMTSINAQLTSPQRGSNEKRFAEGDRGGEKNRARALYRGVSTRQGRIHAEDQRGRDYCSLR